MKWVRVAWASVVLILVLPVTSCSGHSSPSKPLTSARSNPSGVIVSGPADAFPHGRPTIVPETVPVGFEKLIAGPVVQIGDESAQPAKPVELSFPPVTGGAAVHIAYRDDASGWWLPVPTSRNAATGRLTATVDHFSWWTTILDKVTGLTAGAPDSVSNGASWLEYQAGLILGVRVSRPKCSGGMPQWVKGDLIVNPDANSELFACGQSDGSKLRLKVANNRGYPVTVEFNHPFSRVSTDLPVNLRDIVQRASNPPDGRNTRVFLVAQGTADVTFDRPAGVAGVVDGYARRDAGTMLTDLTFDLLSAAGADLPVGNGKTLGLASLECLGSEATSVTGTVQGMTTGSASKLEQSVTGLRGCMDEVVDTELKRSVPSESRYKHLQSASRFLKVLKGYNFEMLGLDAFVNDATREANLVDIGFRWQGQPSQNALGDLAGQWYRHSTSLVIKPSGEGSYLERTYTPCGTSDDCTYKAKLEVVTSPSGSGVITFTDVRFEDADGKTMKVSKAEHRELDGFFPLEGDQAGVKVNHNGVLRLTWQGRMSRESQRPSYANGFCGQKTTDTSECGA